MSKDDVLLVPTKTLEVIAERLEEHDDRFDAIESKLAEHDRRFDEIDKKLEDLTEVKIILKRIQSAVLEKLQP